ncbi:TPA: polymer-forming cytoskeletal protein [Escherichia coli]|nr:polymer-forming cytoskeletal protein [Escherichia coli]
MKLKLHAINFALFCWISALISKILHSVLLTIIAALLAIAGFIIHFLINSNMFRNKKNELTHTSHTLGEKKPTTVIANSVYIEGDIKLDSNEEIVHILGKLKGNIIANNGGNVEIFTNGNVEGDITCNSLIVNGTLNGHCICESLKIEENGNITGTITYRQLTIKEGGIFSGCAKHSDEWPTPTIHTPSSIKEKNKTTKEQLDIIVPE